MKPKPNSTIRDLAADWVWNHTPCCREMTRLLSQERDAPLPWTLQIRMQLHLICCRWCTRYRHQLQWIDQWVATLSGRECNDAEQQLSEEARDRIRRALTRL